MVITRVVTASAAYCCACLLLVAAAGALPPLLATGLVLGAFAIGIWCECEAEEHDSPGAIYVAILGIQFVIIAMIAGAVFADRLVFDGRVPAGFDPILRPLGLF